MKSAYDVRSYNKIVYSYFNLFFSMYTLFNNLIYLHLSLGVSSFIIRSQSHIKMDLRNCF